MILHLLKLFSQNDTLTSNFADLKLGVKIHMTLKNNYITPVLLVFAIILPGCSLLHPVSSFFTNIMGGKDNATPPNKLVDYPSVLAIDLLWERQIGIGCGKHGIKLTPTIIQGVIFVADCEGLVVAIDSNTGVVIWEIETELALSGGVGQGLDAIYVASSNGKVISLDILKGEEKWRTEVSSEVLAAPVVGDGQVIVRTADGKMTALDEQTGIKNWMVERNVPDLSIRGVGMPLIVSDSVIAGYANGKMLALDVKNGKNIWETSIAIPRGSSEIARLVDLDADLIEADDIIYVASYQNGVSAILAINGDVLWTNKDVSSYAGLSHEQSSLYVADSSGDVWKLDQEIGSSLWRQTKLHQRSLTAPAVYKDYVVVGDFAGYVHWLAANDGKQLARIQVSDAMIIAKPIIDNDTVYIYVSDGTLAALEAKSVRLSQ